MTTRACSTSARTWRPGWRGGSRLALFLLFAVLATVSTWVLSIDTTAVLLAPIGLALAQELGLSALPFAFAAIWLANAASLLLPVSNLTNLLAAAAPRAGRAGFVRADLAAPARRDRGGRRACWWSGTGGSCAGRYPVPRTLPSFDPALLWLAALVVVLIGPAIVVGVPAWLVALAATVVLVAGFVVRRPAAVRPRRLLALVPWSVLVFAVALFVVVELVVEQESSLLTAFFGTGELGGRRSAQLAGTTVVLANVVNNLPAYLVVEPFTGSSDRLVSALVAVNVGPMLLAWGSLANLLWLRSCRQRGLRISCAQVRARVAAGRPAGGRRREWPWWC